MNTLKYKSFILTAAVLLTIGLSSQHAFAQRGGRGGSSGRSGGGAIASRGGRPGGFGGAQVRPNSGSRPLFGNRPSFGGRPSYGYRPGYGSRPRVSVGFGFRRPYYNFYRPYLGIRLTVLPFGYYPFYFGQDQFYYSSGLFYRQDNNAYTVVVPPVGAEVPNLPNDAKQIQINGQTYYEYKGVYYTTKASQDGKTTYVVAGKDGVLDTDGNTAGQPQIGDIVTALPEGYREVVLKGQKYYVSQEDIYYEEVVDGNNVSYRVIGKLF